MRSRKAQKQSNGRGYPESGRLVIGRRALQEIVRHACERIERVFVADGRAERSSGFTALLDEIEQSGVVCRAVCDEELDNLAHTSSHQGFVVILKERSACDFKSFLKECKELDEGLVLMLDSVFDPQNLGAILRAAECFGADAVIWSRNKGCGLSPSATKAAAGASELVRCFQVSNLVESLKKIKHAGFWAVATDAGTGAQSLHGFDFSQKTVLAIGSEGKGLSPLLLKECDFRVKIPMLGKIESLNVSQAAATFLYAYRAQYVDKPQ